MSSLTFVADPRACTKEHLARSPLPLRPDYHELGLDGRTHGIVSLRRTLTCASSLANLIQRDNPDLFNSAHMGSFTPRLHDNCSEANLVVMDRS